MERQVYFVTGLAAIGKTSAILPTILKKARRHLFLISTDALRPTNVSNGHDDHAWKHTLKLISYHLENSLGSDIFIEGVAFEGPDRIKEILQFEEKHPEIKIKLVYVGSTRTAKRVEKPEKYYRITEADVARSTKYGRYIQELSQSHSNYRFVDLMEAVLPGERRLQEPVELKESDLMKNAEEVIKFLL